jgi:WD40 repeat protein
MRRRLILCLAATALWLCGASETRGATAEQRQKCLGSDDAASISACSEIAENDRETTADRVQAYTARAAVYFVQGKYQRAVDDYTSALGLDPNDAGLLRRRGENYAQLRRFARAVEDYDASLRLNPKDPQTFFGRSIARQRLGDHDGFLADRAEYKRLRRQLHQHLDGSPAIGAELASEDAVTRPPRLVLRGHDGPVAAVAFSSDGQMLVSASDDGTARLWRVADGTLVAVLDHADEVTAAAFSPDGTRIVTASADGTIALWDGHDGHALAKLEKRSRRVSSVMFSGDGRRLVAASFDQTVQLADTQSGSTLRSWRPYDKGLNRAVFSPDDKRIATTSAYGPPQLWDAATGALVIEFKGGASGFSPAFSPDGALFTAASFDGTARVWDVAAGSLIATLPHGADHELNRVRFSPDGRWVLTAGGHTARLWEAATGKALATFSPPGTVGDAAFAPDGKSIVTACWDDTARLWATATGTLAAVFNHDDYVETAAFSPDGTQIATASKDYTVRLWPGTGPSGR